MLSGGPREITDKTNDVSYKSCVTAPEHPWESQVDELKVWHCIEISLTAVETPQVFWGGIRNPAPIYLNFYKLQFCKKFKIQEKNFGGCSGTGRKTSERTTLHTCTSTFTGTGEAPGVDSGI